VRLLAILIALPWRLRLLVALVVVAATLPLALYLASALPGAPALVVFLGGRPALATLVAFALLAGVVVLAEPPRSSSPHAYVLQLVARWRTLSGALPRPVNPEHQK